jgi:hypothetical protein
MISFKKFIIEAYDIPLKTQKDIASFDTNIDKPALKKLLSLLKKSNKVVIPLVGNEKGKVKIRSSGGTKKDVEKTKKSNEKILSKWKKSNNITTKVIDHGDGTIRGSGEEKKLFNQGDTAEGVFAALLFMKFADKPLTEKQCNKILYKLKLGSEYNAKTKTHKKIQDTIKLIVNLAPKPWADLTNPEFEDLRSKLFTSAKEYTNSKNVNKYNNYFKSNGILDEIKIIADGVGGQTTTKTDIYVELTRVINGESVSRRLNLNISLKAGSIKQFGQVSGSSFEHLNELWKTFGIDISKVKKKMDKLAGAGDVSLAIHEAYKEAHKMFKSDFKAKTEDMETIVKLFNSVIHHATLGENVELVQLDKGTFTRYSFKKTKRALIELAKAHNFTAIIKIQKGKIPLPKITLMMDDKPFLSIRSKSDVRENGSFYARNYIEKEKAFSTIFSKKYEPSGK